MKQTLNDTGQKFYFFPNRKGKPLSHGFTYWDDTVGDNTLVTALQSTDIMLEDAELAFSLGWATRSSPLILRKDLLKYALKGGQTSSSSASRSKYMQEAESFSFCS